MIERANLDKLGVPEPHPDPPDNDDTEVEAIEAIGRALEKSDSDIDEVVVEREDGEIHAETRVLVTWCATGTKKRWEMMLDLAEALKQKAGILEREAWRIKEYTR